MERERFMEIAKCLGLNMNGTQDYQTNGTNTSTCLGYNSFASASFGGNLSSSNLTGGFMNCTQTPIRGLGHDYTLETVRNLIKTVLVPSICILGVIGNALTLLVLTRKRLTSSCDGNERTVHLGLFSLAISDLLCCMSIFPVGFISENKFAYSSVNFRLVYKTFSGMLINVFFFSSTWLTVTMATSRYLAICHPFRARHMIGLTGTKASIFLVFLFSILFNIPRFFSYRIQSMTCIDGGIIYYKESGPMQLSSDIKRKVYIWVYFGMGIVLPLIMLAFCNICLVKALRESTKLRRRYRVPAAHVDSNHRITSILVTIVVMYILCVSPAEILLFIDERLRESNVENDYQQLSTAMDITNILQAINFACDFVLYFVLNVHFRQALREMFYSVVSKLFGCKDPKAKSRKKGRSALYSQASISRNTTTIQTVL